MFRLATGMCIWMQRSKPLCIRPQYKGRASTLRVGLHVMNAFESFTVTPDVFTCSAESRVKSQPHVIESFLNSKNKSLTFGFLKAKRGSSIFQYLFHFKCSKVVSRHDYINKFTTTKYELFFRENKAWVKSYYHWMIKQECRNDCPNIQVNYVSFAHVTSISGQCKVC